MTTSSHKILLITLTGIGALACSASAPPSTDSTTEEADGTTTTDSTGTTGATTDGTTTAPADGTTTPAPTGTDPSPTTPVVTPVDPGTTPTTPPVTATCVDADGSAPMIDDLSDNDKNLTLGDGRNGKWAVAADGAGSLADSAGDVAPENGEYCLRASGHNEWGANLSAYLVEPRGCYDASAYTGVCFMARGSLETPSVEEGGIITGTTDGTVVFSVTKNSTEYDACGATCGDANSVDLANEDLDENTLQEFCYDWADLGLTDASDLWRLEWKLPAWSWEGVDASVDGFICVDDVRFR